MKIQAVKKLIEMHSLAEIAEAEQMILDGQSPSISIEGEDEGEQLTHAFAAIYILKKMEDGLDYKEALREFTQKVRTSIS